MLIIIIMCIFISNCIQTPLRNAGVFVLAHGKRTINIERNMQLLFLLHRLLTC